MPIRKKEEEEEEEEIQISCTLHSEKLLKRMRT